MKYFLISLLFFFFSSQQKVSLTGSYKLEYENAPYLQSGTIVFNDSVYAMELSKGLKSKGTVTYGKDLTFLKEGNLDQNIVLSFSTNDIEKDTISFQFNNKNSGVKNNQLSVSFSGKLIKIK